MVYYHRPFAIFIALYNNSLTLPDSVSTQTSSTEVSVSLLRSERWPHPAQQTPDASSWQLLTVLAFSRLSAYLRRQEKEGGWPQA